MIQNNLDPEVAERPEDLVVYGGIGKAARNWESFDKILECLRDLNEDETLMVQSGKPVGVLRSHKNAPRVLIANSNLVGRWATWEHFRELEAKGLMMYGQMTAGSWIYIGSQGIVQGTYETYLSLAAINFNGTLKGTLNVTAGLGGMGGAQPLAITMNEGVCLAAEIEEWRMQKRIETRYLDEYYHDIDEAIDRALDAKAKGEAVSIGVCCNVVDLLQRLIDRNITPDTLTDQTSAHDELIGYFKQFTHVWMSRQPGYLMQARALFMLILHRLLSNIRRDSARADQRVNQVLVYVAEHYAEELDLAGMAEIVGLHPVYLGKLFKKNMGYSFKEHLNMIRINHAEMLLSTGGFSVTQVAERCGFRDISYFSNVFKSVKGYPPSTVFKCQSG